LTKEAQVSAGGATVVSTLTPQMQDVTAGGITVVYRQSQQVTAGGVTVVYRDLICAPAVGRTSGRNALIRIALPDGTLFDASGVSIDGRARSNKFTFEIRATLIETGAFNQMFVEPHMVHGTVAGTLMLFYNNAPAEANVVLETLRRAQHQATSCTDAGAATMYVYPTGLCNCRERWRLRKVVFQNVALNVASADVMVLWCAWRAADARRMRVVLED